MTQAQFDALAEQICKEAPQHDGYTVLKAIVNVACEYLEEDGCGRGVEWIAKALERAKR